MSVSKLIFRCSLDEDEDHTSFIISSISVGI